jgi:ATP-dependent Lon protease
MTGEITLRGDVLPIGGLKEKVLAARGAGVKAIVLPKLNERDLGEIPEHLKKGLTFHFVEHMDEVLDIALISADPKKSRKKKAAKKKRPARR